MLALQWQRSIVIQMVGSFADGSALNKTNLLMAVLSADSSDQGKSILFTWRPSKNQARRRNSVAYLAGLYDPCVLRTKPTDKRRGCLELAKKPAGGLGNKKSWSQMSCRSEHMAFQLIWGIKLSSGY